VSVLRTWVHTISIAPTSWQYVLDFKAPHSDFWFKAVSVSYRKHLKAGWKIKLWPKPFHRQTDYAYAA